ncbi:MAG: LamG domain-containing protein [Actinomycetes bacterium]
MKKSLGASKAAKLIIIGILVITQASAFQNASANTFEKDRAVDLSGSSQYGYAGDSAALRTFNAITIEAWVMPQTTCDGHIIAKSEDYAIYCVSGVLYYALGGATNNFAGVATTVKLATDEWHHVAISRATNTNSVNLYVDGQLQYQGTADKASTGPIRSTTDSFLYVGSRGPAGVHFNGLIDEVRIFNIARSQDEIASDMHNWGNFSESSVVGYYDFNNISGSTVTNKATSADSNSDLTLVGSPTLVDIESSVNIDSQTVTTFPRTYLNSDLGWFGPSNVTNYRVLVVAGGGGGGGDEGGGGGAGGLIESSTVTLPANLRIEVKVGQGGKGATGTESTNYGTQATPGNNGQNSIVGSITTTGGGGGGTSQNYDDDINRKGTDGGSGGGGAGEAYALRTAGNGITGQGKNGGDGISSGSGGGGGGGSQVGNTNGNGRGGDGIQSDITDSTVPYAGGGGGGNGNTSSTRVAGGTGGGGTGGSSTTANTTGTANRGGGGGGGCGPTSCGPAGIQYSGASGGSGIVILRYTPITDQTITLSSLETSSKTYPYSQALTMSTSGSSGSGAITYAVRNDSASGCTLTGSSSNETLTASTSGTCLVSATIAADDYYNSATSSELTFTFSKANQASLSIPSSSGSYGTPIILTTTGGNGAGSVTYSAALGIPNCTISGETLTADAAGTCLVTATKASDTNYNSVVSSEASITFAAISTTASISLASGALTYRQAKLITAFTSVAGKVTFRVNNKILPRCKKKSTTGSTPNIIATCSYRPSNKGSVTISATLNPTNSSYIGTVSTSDTYFVYKRTGARGG